MEKSFVHDAFAKVSRRPSRGLCEDHVYVFRIAGSVGEAADKSAAVSICSRGLRGGPERQVPLVPLYSSGRCAPVCLLRSVHCVE